MAMVQPAGAVVAKPGLIEAAQPDGTTLSIRLEGNEDLHFAYAEDGTLLTEDENGFYVPATDNEIAEKRRQNALKRRSGPGLMYDDFPAYGERRALVILVQFTNRKFTINNPKDFYTRMLNENGFSDSNSTGSARDYFIASSDSIFRPVFDVYGPVTVPNDYSYYGKNDFFGNDSQPERMVIDACNLLDEEIDFTLYDCDGNGVVDNIYIFYAGYGEADGGGANTIWPHSWDLSKKYSLAYVYDGVKIDHYACSNELQRMGNRPDGIGTFCHEFGHVLGLPDLYSTMSTGAFTPYTWTIMDSGSYNNNSRTPPYYSSFEKYALGWIEPETLDEGEKTLLPLGDSNRAFIVRTSSENEYYLLENRQKKGFDTYLPGHGMLIWHIDYNRSIWVNNMVNVMTNHQYVDLIEADGERLNQNRDGDSFPGVSEVTSFTPETNPGWAPWTKELIPLMILDIEETEDGVIKFNVEEYELSKIREY